MDRTTGIWLSYFRVAIGSMWLFELTLGRWWKIGLTTGLHPGWLGPDAGSELTFLGERAIAEGTFPWAQWLLETVFLPHAPGWSSFVVALELAIALSFLFGLLTRFFAFWAVGLSFVILSLGTARIQPFFAMAHLAILWSGGGTVGLDQVILRRIGEARGHAARVMAAAIRFAVLPRRVVPVLASACVLLAVYYVVQVTQIEAERMQLAGLELAVLFGLAGVGLFAGDGRDTGSMWVPIDLVRIFVGFKLLQGVFGSVDPGLGSLPDFASSEALAGAFQEVVLHHAAPMTGLVEWLILPYVSFWAVAFGVLQVVAGIHLLLGWRSRTGAFLGLALLVPLVALGFLRLAPFLLVYLVFLAGVGSGRLFAVDGHGGIRSPRSAEPFPVVRRLGAPLAAVALVLLLLAGLLGLETDGYRETMPGFSAFFLALPAAVLSILGHLTRRDPT